LISSASGARDQTRKLETLRSRAEFQAIYKKGQRRRGLLVALFYAERKRDASRVGITVTKKSGKAVRRNRIRRRIREILRAFSPTVSSTGIDLVVHVHPQTRDATYTELRNEIGEILTRVSRATNRRPGGNPGRAEGGRGKKEGGER
jgi:ribonuclease P protein component